MSEEKREIEKRSSNSEDTLSDKIKKKRKIEIWILIGLIFFGIIIPVAYNILEIFSDPAETTTGQVDKPEDIPIGFFSSEQDLLKGLESENPSTIHLALEFMCMRKLVSGRGRAVELLKHENYHVWYKAALYLGQMGEKESIPYLIKGFTHRWAVLNDEAKGKIAAYLNAMTGEQFGNDQSKWVEWWKKNNPEKEFNFIDDSVVKEALQFKKGHYYRINGAEEPLRIGSGGPQIRLIGIKLKPDADLKETVKQLNILVAAQWVELKFDDGEKLDDKNARRALVYWQDIGGDKKMLKLIRNGMPEVPFKKETLINAYLIKTGLYELDLESINSEEVKKLLKEAVEENK